MEKIEETERNLNLAPRHMLALVPCLISPPNMLRTLPARPRKTASLFVHPCPSLEYLHSCAEKDWLGHVLCWYLMN